MEGARDEGVYVEGRLREGIRLIGLAIPMGGSREDGFPGRVDQVDETMCDVPIFLSFGEWVANRRVGSATKRY